MAGIRFTDQCCLCLDELLTPNDAGELDLSTYPCGHPMHTKCVQQLWARNDSKCPQCKADSAQWARQYRTNTNLAGMVKIYLSANAPAPIDVEELDLDTADADRLRREVTKLREALLSGEQRLANMQEQRQLVLDEKHQAELKCQSYVQEMQGVRTENNTLKGMNQRLKVDLERTKTIVASKELMWHSLNDAHSKLELEARKLRISASLSEAFQTMDNGADAPDVIGRLIATDDKEMVEQLKKILTHTQKVYKDLQTTGREQAKDLERTKDALNRAKEKQEKVRKENVDLKETVKREAARREEAEKDLKGTIEQLRRALESKRASREPRASTLPAQSSTTPPTAPRQEHKQATIQLDDDEDDEADEDDDALSQTLDLDPAPHSSASASSHSHPSTTSSSPTRTSPEGIRSSFAARAPAGIMGVNNRRSLLGGPQKVILSNDPDNGGKYVRSGPDGKGGTVSVCVAGARKGVLMSGGVGQKRGGAGGGGPVVKKGKQTWSAASKQPHGNIAAFFQHG